MNKFNLSKDILNLSILTLITVLTWVGFDVYRVINKQEIPDVLQKQLALFETKINQETILSLESKTTFSPEELNRIDFKITKEEEFAATDSALAKP